MSEEILQEINRSDINKLIKLLHEALPDSIVAYDWIRMQIEWERKIPGLKVYIMCPNGDYSSGIVVAYTDNLASYNRKFGLIYAIKGKENQLAEILMNTKSIPWHLMYHFTSIHERNVDGIVKAASAAGVILPPLQPQGFLAFTQNNYEGEELKALIGFVHFMKSECADIGIHLKKLNGSHINDVWNLRNYFSECYKPVIKAALEYNPCYGMFTDINGKETLVSLVMHGEHGGLAMGQTHEDYKHKGLNKILGCALMIEMSKCGYINPHGVTHQTNSIAKDFMMNHGFNYVGPTRRIEISPIEAPRSSL